MFTASELKIILARIPPSVLAELNAAMSRGRTLEAQRIVARYTGDGVRASEVVASLIRREVTGR